MALQSDRCWGTLTIHKEMATTCTDRGCWTKRYSENALETHSRITICRELDCTDCPSEEELGHLPKEVRSLPG